MKRRFTILTAALALLTFLAVPMGMRGQTTVTYKLTIDANDFNSTSYAANNNEKTSLAVCTTDNTKTYEVNWTSYQVMLQSGEMQWQSNKGKIYNSTNLGTITSVNVTSSAGTFTTYYGTSEQPAYGNSGEGKGFFKTFVGNATGKSSKVEVLFEIEEGGVSTYTLTYNRNGANSGNVPVDNTVYDATNNVVTVVGNTGNLAKEHYSFGGWNTKADGTGTNYVAGDTFIIEASTTLYAKWNLNTHTASFSVNGTTTSTQVAEGAAITFPSDPASINEKVFMGWTDAPINGTQSEAPNFVTSATMGTSDVTFYAVFATADASGEPVETKSQTLQYDTWSYSGSTTDKSSYRLFHSGSYIESAAFDLSKLSKVIVYGGTFGGSSYNSLTIGDGTNVWKNVTVSGSSQTGLNTYTGGTALSGTKPLRIISNSGTASGTGIRISKVEIYTLEPSIVYSDYCTTVEVSTDPTVTVTPNTINAPFVGEEGTLSLTYENIEEFSSFDYYFCDANGNALEDTDPDYPDDWIYAEINEPGEEENYTLSYIIDANDGAARTAYMKVFTYDDNMEEVYAIVTVNQAKYVADYATLPFAYDGNGTGELPAGFTCYDLDTYSSSPKMQFNSTGDWAILKINERPGILTFDIKGNGFSGGTFKVQTSEDGTTYTDLAIYTSDNLGSTVQSEEFYNLGAGVRYIKWIYTNKSSGNVALGNINLAPYVAPQQYDLTVSTLSSNVNGIYVFNTEDENNPLIANGVAGTVQVYERTSIMISPVVAQGCVLASLMVNNVNVIDQLDESGAYTFTMPSQNVTISATAMATTTYTLATTIESGRHYIITNGDNRAMGAQNDNNRAAVEISINGNTAIVTSADVREVVINGPDANNNYTIYDAAEPGFLYAANNSKNHLKTETHLDSDKNGLWKITFNEDKAVIKAQGTNSHNWMLYNTSGLFSCYTGTSESVIDEVYLYVKDETTPQYDFYKDIAGHTETSGWNFIASPVGTAPANMTALSDLYFYDEDDSYWRNKDVAANAAGFNFAIGNGYLAASNDDITLSFSGTSIITSETYQIQLDYSGETNPLVGWNLVGNPYPHRAYANMPYYIIDGMRLNPNAQTTDVPVDFCAGIMVKATGNGQSVTFSKTPANSNSNQLEMTVAQQVMSRGTATSMVHDNAIVNFNAGSQLEKFPFNADAAELYIPQDGKDYAIVSSEAQGEMPVNFKAKENGTYTLSINVEGVEMNYLHLIDNKTGNDIDLLQTPSYSFEAKTTDYESRFKLVFVANNEDSVSAGSETFAFFSNGSFVINNEGNAELQVIDITGRIVKSESINGCANVNVNAAPGVYMLRLVNGTDVKTQKVVVK